MPIELRTAVLKTATLDARDWNDEKGPLRVVLGNVTLLFESGQEIAPLLFILKRAERVMQGESGMVRCPKCRRTIIRLEDRASTYKVKLTVDCPCGHTFDTDHAVTKA